MRLDSDMRRGFTVVELSLVLVIIGLVIGGVVVGRDLIRAAELRQALSQIESLNTAIHTFRLKYGQLPGDFATATDVWGEMPANMCGAAEGILDGTTCNGDGDGTVSQLGGSNEIFYSPQHLSLAGLIPGTYPGGVLGGTLNGSMTGTWPTFGDRGGMLVLNYNDSSIVPDEFAVIYGHVYQAIRWDNVNDPATVPLQPMESYGLDSKLDDGLPAKGHVRSGVNVPCTTDADPDVAQYNVGSDDVVCAIVIRAEF